MSENNGEHPGDPRRLLRRHRYQETSQNASIFPLVQGVEI
jgi:hypothetical protein